MASQGPNSPGTMVDDATVGTVAWTNPNNAKVSDNVYAKIPAGAQPTTHYLKATNFGFSIPSGATINGILVEIEKQYNEGIDIIVTDNEVKIVKADGSIGTTNKALGGNWSNTDAYSSYGGATDLWGETWDDTKINDADFGVVLRANRSGADPWVDHIRITVYYTEGASGTNLQVQVGDVFRPVSEVHVNVGDVWRPATAFVNVGDVWRA